MITIVRRSVFVGGLCGFAAVSLHDITGHALSTVSLLLLIISAWFLAHAIVRD